MFGTNVQIETRDIELLADGLAYYSTPMIELVQFLRNVGKRLPEYVGLSCPAFHLLHLPL
jgi:hypothetical protein